MMIRTFFEDVAHYSPLVLLLLVLGFFIIGFMYAVLQKSRARPFLDRTMQKIQLIDKYQLSHDSFKLRFELPNKNDIIGLPAGQHVKIYCPNVSGKIPGQWNGLEDHEKLFSEVSRKYTPTTGNEYPGFVEFVVKVYRAGSPDKFVDGGKVSQYCESLSIGDYIDISGPFGMVNYKGFGELTHGQREIKAKKIGMVAGGSGITPMIQILRKSLSIRGDDTQFWLIYANKSEDDILLRDMLDELAIHHPNQLKVWYTIDRPSTEGVASTWKYSTGYITKEMLEKHLPSAGDETIVFLCGPRPMTEMVCRPNLEELGWNQDAMLKL